MWLKGSQLVDREDKSQSQKVSESLLRGGGRVWPHLIPDLYFAQFFFFYNNKYFQSVIFYFKTVTYG